MNIPGLPITIIGHRAEPPPMRSLEITCDIANPASFDIYILDAWVKVDALGLVLAEGRLFHAFYNRVEPAIIKAGKQGLGAFHIELPAQVIHHIEERRAGGDVKLTVSSKVLVSEVFALNASATLKPPYESCFGDKGLGYFEHLIPQSEWLKLLKSLSWSELEILELPSARLRAIPSLARALQRFQDAQQNFRNGAWEETMMNCRKAFEAIVQDVCGELDMSKAHEVFVSILGEGEKANRFDKLAKSLGHFLHLGRHETLPSISIKRADAQLALLLTGGLLIYLGQQ